MGGWLKMGIPISKLNSMKSRRAGSSIWVGRWMRPPGQEYFNHGDGIPGNRGSRVSRMLTPLIMPNHSRPMSSSRTEP